MEHVAVTGHEGRLGSHLVDMGAEPMHCDIADSSSVEAELERVRPLTIINCAAYTAVDNCEKPENVERAIRSNTTGPGVLRAAFFGYLIHMSTGYVFDGEDGPYSEDAKPSPVNMYGMTKLGGEAALAVKDNYPTLIVRVLDLFGPGESPDFVKSILRVLQSGRSKELPENLMGTPTYIPHLAEALVACIERGDVGTLHLGGTATVSRFEWGRMIAEAFNLDTKLIQPTTEIKGLAERPLNAALDVSKARNLNIPLYSPVKGLDELRWELESD